MTRVRLALQVLSGTVALAAGVAATRLHGQAHSAALVTMLAGALGLAACVSGRVRPAGTSDEKEPQGDPAGLDAAADAPATTTARATPTQRPAPHVAYTPPRSLAVRAWHVLLSLAFNLGLAALAFAAAVRLGWLGPAPQQLVAILPLAAGLLTAALAVAALQRVRDQGVRTSRALRVQGIVVALIGLAAATILAASVRRPALVARLPLSPGDPEVLVLLGVLAALAQVFAALGLPTLLDIGSGRATRRPDGPRHGTPPVVYAILAALAAAAVIAIALASLPDASTLGRAVDLPRGSAVVAAVIVAAFVIGVWVQARREKRRGLVAKRMDPERRKELMLYLGCTAAGVVLASVLVLNLMDRIDHIGPFPGGRGLSMDLLTLILLVVAGPVGWHLSRKATRRDAMETRLPDFLNDLAETRRAGVTMVAALHACAGSDYGALTPEVRKMANQVSWGVPFGQAFAALAERVRTDMVRRSTNLVIEATRTGGSVATILKAAARDAAEIKALEADRRVSMMTYLIVLYVVFFVFLSVIAVLDVQFIPQVVTANAAVGSSGRAGLPVGGSPIDAKAMGFAFFMAGYVQAIGNGIVGGVLTEGRVSAGLKHVAIMALASWAVFRLLV